MGFNVPIVIDFDALDRFEAQFAKPVDGIYEGPAIANVTTVAIADSNAGSGDSLDGFQATDPDSVANYGVQAGNVLVTILASPSDAAALAFYLQRPTPDYWFSDIEIQFAALTDAQRDTVAVLDIGDLIKVSKRFPNVTNPVVEDLFVEGVEHQITPSGHTMKLYCSPAIIYADFILDTSALDDLAYGLG
jgi:hypothetical protein